MSGKIVVVGSSNVDLIMKMERLPQVGETITGATFMQTFGGKGANQAVAAARAAARADGDDSDVCFVSCVGGGPPDGGYGDLIVENLRRDGIDVDYVFREDGVASGEARYKVDAYRVEAVDTTAAGDAFCGSLAVALAEGKSLVEGVRFASAAAAITVTRLGAQPSIPHRAEIESLIEAFTGKDDPLPSPISPPRR